MAENVVTRIDIDVRGSDSADRATAALDKLVGAEERATVSSDKLEKVRERSSAAADRIAKRYDAEYRAVQQLAKDQAALNRAYDAGLGGTLAYERALAGVTRQQAELSKAVNDNSKAAGLARHEWTNLSRQLQDVGTMLASGSSPMQVLSTQGAQFYDIFSSSKGGLLSGLKEFAGVATRFLFNPITVGVAVVAAATYSFMRWRDEIAATTIALNGLGRASGQTVNGVMSLSQSAADRAGISASSARGVAGQMLNAGVSGSNIEGGVGASVEFSRRFGVELEAAGQTLSKALADPAKGAETLAKQYGLVTFAEQRQISEIAALGNKSEASARLVSILNQRLAEMEEPTSRMAKLWETVKKGFFDGLDKIGRGIDRVIDGPAETQRKAEQRAKSALQGTLRGLESAEQERSYSLDKMREDSALAVKEINARTYAERELIARQRAWNEVMRSEVPDAIKAAMAAETERAKMLAESAKKVEDLSRTTNDNAALARASNPLERQRMEIENARRDFLRENVPSASAAPMVKEFDTAAMAARNVSVAFDGLAGKIGGSFGRLIPLSEWKNGIAPSPTATGSTPYSDIIRGEGTARYGDPYNASLGYMKSPKPLVDMTMAESLAWGDKVRAAQGMNSSAKGAFQITNTTQRDAMKALGLSDADIFSAENQRAMADWIYKTQGPGAWEGLKNGTPGARQLTVSRSGVNDNSLRASANANFDTQLDTAEYSARIKTQEDFAKSIILSRDALETRIATLGMDQRAIDEATKRQELMNEAIKATGNILPEQKRWIEENAAAWTDYQKRVRDADRQQRQSIENLDLARSTLSGSLGGGLKALAKGEDVGAALQQSMSSAMDRMIDVQSNRLSEILLGAQGTAGGGLLGDFLGLGGQRQTAQMNVQAGVVTVNGGVGAAGGGGLVGGAVGWLGDLFNIGKNAEGTDNWRGGPTWVGERGPEIINLPRGSQVMSNSDSVAYAKSLAAAGRSAGAGGSGSHPPTQVSFINAPGGEAEVKETRRSDGGVSLEVTFKKMLKKAIASGAIDREMGSAYGARRQAKSR